MTGRLPCRPQRPLLRLRRLLPRRHPGRGLHRCRGPGPVRARWAVRAGPVAPEPPARPPVARSIPDANREAAAGRVASPQARPAGQSVAPAAPVLVAPGVPGPAVSAGVGHRGTAAGPARAAPAAVAPVVPGASVAAERAEPVAVALVVPGASVAVARAVPVAVAPVVLGASVAVERAEPVAVALVVPGASVAVARAAPGVPVWVVPAVAVAVAWAVLGAVAPAQEVPAREGSGRAGSAVAGEEVVTAPARATRAPPVGRDCWARCSSFLHLSTGDPAHRRVPARRSECRR